jgi:multidrug resistance efflux pump
MIIIALLYMLLVWLVFFKLKIVSWNWKSRTIASLLGIAIIAIFVALLNTLTPSGRIAVIGRVVEVTPNVSGTVTEIAVAPNVLVKAGALLFQIDNAPYEAKVKQLKAAVVEARQKVEQLKAQVELAVAEVKGLASQFDYAERRRDDMEKLARTSATSEFKLQDAAAQASLLDAQLQAARAREINARLALGSEIDGVNTTVAQLDAQLDQAEWELDQTSVRASQDGYVSTMALAVGARVVPARSALSFIIRDDIHIIAIFDQNGFKTIDRGSLVKVVFANRPGKIYRSRISDISMGIGQGQLAVSGTLARAETVGTVSTFPASIEIPKDLEADALRLGIVGTATVISDGAGPIGFLASLLLWIKAFVAYL